MTGEARAARGGPRRRQAWIVLMYHRLGDGGAGREPGEEIYTVRVESFAEQMEALRERGHSVRDLEDLLSGAQPPATRGVALTFDDGSHSDAAVAAPILARHGFPATFFITPAWIETPGFMGWGDVRELMRLGMTLGAHGLDHSPLNALSETELRHQLREAKREIASRTGRVVTALSLPGGAGGSREWRVAREEGFRIVAGSVPRPFRPDRGAGGIVPRYAVRRADGVGSVVALADQRHHALCAASARHVVLRLLRRFLGEGRYQSLRARWGHPEAS